MPAASPPAASYENLARDMQLWSHFAEIGGRDKNTMVTVVSWILGLAALAIGYMVTAKYPTAGSIRAVAVLGLVLSILGGCLTLVYAGYSNRNWAKADEIASGRWGGTDDTGAKTSGRSMGFRLAHRLSRPCDPTRELAPVFIGFALLSALAALINVAYLIWPT